MVLAQLEGVEDINAAMRLKNRIVHIARKDVRLPEGGFFLADLIGASVVEEDGRELGILAEVLDLPAGNVYVVRGRTGAYDPRRSRNSYCRRMWKTASSRCGL
jgi:16S rRNA processing protein RimM